MTATAQLIRQGRGQAIRLPRDFQFAGKAVTLRRTRQGVLITPSIAQEKSMQAAAEAYEAFLSMHSVERADMDDWAAAALVDDIESSRP